MMNKNNRYISKAIALIAALLLNFLYLPVYAASLTAVSDTMTSNKLNTVSNHTIKFTTPTGVDAPTDTITITLPSGFTVGTVDYTDIDLSWGASTGYETEETLAATAASATWGAAFGGLVLTLTPPTNATTGEITATSKVIVEIGTNATAGVGGDQRLQNPNSLGTKVIYIAGNFGDTGSFATSIITDDQVVVSTTIDPYVAFVLTTNTVSLTKSGGGNPDYNSTGYSQGTANTLAANTNAVSGYTISYNGDTLKGGPGNAYTIDAMATKAVSATNTEQFGINLKLNTTPSTGTEPSGSGTGTPAADYATQNQYRYIANTATTLASATAATLSNTYTVTYIANVSQVTEAATYTTTITYICTGNF
jgi:hypothetical protein